MNFKNLHLFQLFLSLSDKEQVVFGQWLAQKRFDKKQVLRDFLGWMIENKSGDWENWDRKRLYVCLFGNQKFNDQKLRNAMYQLQQLIQEFLLFEKVEVQDAGSQIQLLRIFQERGLNDLFVQHLKKLKNNETKQSLRDYHFYQRQFEILQMEDAFTVAQQRSLPTNFQESDTVLEYDFIIRKLRQACSLLGHQNISNTNYEFGMLEVVLKYIVDKDLLKIPVINLYYNGYQSLANPDNNLFFEKFQSLLFQYEHQLSSTETGELYLRVINHYIKKINQGEAGFLEPAFDLYRSGIAKGYLLENQKLSRFIYRNTVFAGLKLEKYDEVFAFIHDYQSCLDSQYRKSTFEFCLARYHYTKGELSAAIDVLQQANYDDLISNLAAKTLLAKIYYETHERDVLDYYLLSFEAYVKRKKVMGYHRTNYLNIISSMKKLLKIAPYDDKGKEKLRRKIEALHPLTEKRWFLKQI